MTFVCRAVPRVTAAAVIVTGLLCALDTRDPAPPFKVKTLDGEKFDNTSLKGRVVLLQFWATWCRYCRGDQNAVDAVNRDYAGQGLLVLAVNVGESKKKVKQYLADSPRDCKIVLTEDTNLAAMFAAKSFPLYVLIDRQGNIVGTQRGAGGEDMLRRLLRKAGLTEPQG
jgi:thiol-disulfide isomerase/thioredoxin